MRNTLLLIAFVVWLECLHFGAVWSSLCFLFLPCSVKQGGEAAAAPRAVNLSRRREGQSEAGSSPEGGTCPTRPQRGRDLFKYLYLRIYVIPLIRFLYFISYFAPIFYVFIHPALKAGGRWYLLVCMLERDVEQTHHQY